MQTQIQRRKVFINKSLQSKIAGVYTMVLVLGMILSNCLFYTLTLFRGQAGDENWQTYIKPLTYANIISNILVILLAVFMTVLISHRIAGPLYRLSRLMEQMGRGDFNIDTRLRKKDELVPFAQAMAEMAGNLKSRIGAVKQAALEVEKSLGSTPPNELVKAVDQLKVSLQDFHT